ncbi:hypothetical protein WJX72_008583 [[Myrmecia] bisecta]|uniref:Photosystem II 10 kDa polypeptide, chloroplastic n=1 Tax=[Myrmecia] bisecta TaxID=41462 RepID=A0AAW1Q1C2_9CHLO
MASTAVFQKSFTGVKLNQQTPRSRVNVQRGVVASGKKIDIKKIGVSSVQNDVVRANLSGVSRKMKDKNWRDSQGRKGKGYGVYRFSDKYGANVDGYSPIYTPDVWSEGGNQYTLGTKGLLAWAGLVVVLLGVGVTLILTTSQLGQ